MSKKGKDMGVFNIVDNRTGKKYTAGSTNMDQLKNQYKNKIEHANHHNEELRKDIENGHTFRFEEVSRDCQTEEEIRALRDAEIYRNRNNTYNKDVNIYFDGGNPNAEYPKGKSEVKFNNVEDFPTSHNNIKPKEVKNKSNKQTKTKKVPKSHRDNPRYYGKNKIPEKPNRNLGSNRRVRHNTPKQNLGPKGGVLHKIIELKKYTDRYDSLISNDFKNKLIRGIERREIVNKTHI